MPDFGVARARLATRGYGSPWFVDLVLGRPEGHDSAIITAGVSVQWTPTLETYVNYDGQLGRHHTIPMSLPAGSGSAFRQEKAIAVFRFPPDLRLQRNPRRLP
jgi:hypothetical protein